MELTTPARIGTPVTPSSSASQKNSLQTIGWLIVVIWGLVQAKAFLVPICIASLLAFLVTPLVRILRNHRAPEWVAIACASTVLVLPFLTVGAAFVQQGARLIRDYPSIIQSVSHSIVGLTSSPLAQKFGLTSDTLDMASIGQKISESAGKGIAIVVGGLSLLMDAGSQTVLILIFALLMVASRKHLRVCSEKILSGFRSIETGVLLDEVVSLIERFLVARLLIAAIIGGMILLTLRLFDVPYSLLLGVGFGVMTLIPAIGFIIALVPTLIMAMVSGHSAISVVSLTVVLLVISFIEGNILSPKLVGRKLNLNVLASFIGLFAGGLLWGVWGMFLSIPVMGVLRIVFSAVPGLQGWGDLMAEREDRELALSLLRKPRKVA